MKYPTVALGVLALQIVPGVLAQQKAWGQCGGKKWTGPTNCVSGYTCMHYDKSFAQCVPGSAGGPTVTSTTSTKGPKTTTTAAGPKTTTNAAEGEDFENRLIDYFVDLYNKKITDVDNGVIDHFVELYKKKTKQPLTCTATVTTSATVTTTATTITTAAITTTDTVTATTTTTTTTTEATTTTDTTTTTSTITETVTTTETKTVEPTSSAPSPTSTPATSCLAIKGHDISSLALMESERSAVFQDANGQITDAAQILADGGANIVRLRIWTAGEYSIDNALKLARRAKAAGMGILLDPHYSDTWADPGHQSIPASWPTTLSGLNNQIYTYTKNLVSTFASAGIDVDIIQIGNEIRSGLLWPVGTISNFNAMSQLLNSGANGAKDGNPSRPPKIMIHIDNGWNWGQQQWWWDNIQVPGALTLDKVDYIGLSYYPFYDVSATLSALNSSLMNMVDRYNRPIVIVETDWPASPCTGSISEPSIPKTAEGQTQFIHSIANILCGLPRGLGKGIVYWEPTWVTNSALGSSCADNTLFSATWDGTKPTCRPKSSVNMFL